MEVLKVMRRCKWKRKVLVSSMEFGDITTEKGGAEHTRQLVLMLVVHNVVALVCVRIKVVRAGVSMQPLQAR
jgi:hypothetical protein